MTCPSRRAGRWETRLRVAARGHQDQAAVVRGAARSPGAPHRKNQVNVYDIPIALVTEQYLEYLGLMQELNLDLASEFLVMAATLIHIKSRMLLPRPDPAQADDIDEDPRDALVRRLLEHQKFKAAAGLLHDRETLRSAQWTRPDSRVAEIAGEEFEPEVEVDLFSLLAAFRKVLERARERPPVPLPPEQVSIESRIEQTARALVRDRRVRLRGSVRRHRVARRHDRDVPGNAGDDPAEADARVPGGAGGSDPHLSPRAAEGRAASDSRSGG